MDLDEYRILRLIGRGGMGEVYLAHDRLLDRPVAIKFLSVGHQKGDSWQRLLSEARSAARIQHPNVCVVHRVGETDGRPYIVTELIKGRSLAGVASPMPEREVLDVALGLARGLAAAHRHNILHRDIKPANVLRSELGEVKLVDFGIAEFASMEEGTPLVGSGRYPRSTDISRKERELSWNTLSSEEDDSAPVRVRQGGTPVFLATPTPSRNTRRSRRASSSAKRMGTLSVIGLGSRHVVGTPDYVAPELWRGLCASKQSDVYAVGALLYELCVGEAPYGSYAIDELPHVSQVEERAVSLSAPSVDPRFSAIVDRCLARDLSRRFSCAEELSEALEQLVPTPRRQDIPEGNPYRGLNPFEAEHGGLFFGRNEEMRAIVTQLQRDHLVVVAGNSGVGKSSLCRAGVIPYLELGGLQDGREWTCLTLIPGKRPHEALKCALSSLGHLDDEYMLGAPGKGLILFIDQLEELTTIAEPSEADGFCRKLDELILSGLPVRVVGTARSDFVPRLAALHGMGERIGRSLFILRSLGSDGIRDAIKGPVAAKGYLFESEEIVDALVEAVMSMADEGLPLLQFALAELWEHRDQLHKTIPAQALASIGGVTGALERHADTVIGQMWPKAQAQARRMLLSLVTTDCTRTRKTLSELDAEILENRLVLETLVSARLLVVRESDGATVFEIAHEALLSGWRSLRVWLETSDQERALHRRVAQATAEWERLDRLPEILWGPSQLAELVKPDVDGLPPGSREFIRASRNRLRLMKWLRRFMVLSAPVLVGAIVGFSTLRERREIARATGRTIEEVTTALGQARRFNDSLAPERTQVLKLLDSGPRRQAELAWAEVLRKSEKASGLYSDITQRLEGALLIDGSSERLRRLFVEVLYERVLLDERGPGPPDKELLKRLRLFDVNNTIASRFDAPGKVSITSRPNGASVILERYNDIEGRFVPRLVGDLGKTPIAYPINLPPGSYILTFSLTGRATARVPFVVTRAQDQSIDALLPKEDDVPPGFVYVPAGRTIIGARETAETRIPSQIAQQPEHEIVLDGYFMQRTEVTYADWIAYLESLTLQERRLRIPKVTTSAFFGFVQMDRASGRGWELRIGPPEQLYRGRDNGTFVLPDRSRRATQNWHNFPVSGISFFDVQAYIAYVRTKDPRLGKARFCTEHEWERATRGADGRLFPQGNVLGVDDGNHFRTYGESLLAAGPDEVGSYPASRSIFGIDDLIGNVEEWLTGLDYPIILRGGSFRDDSPVLRGLFREVPEYSSRDVTVGFRLCADAPSGDDAGARLE